ncbi:MAG: Mu-like prophage major head subunit gpT family protein [Planctomycetes bacterium]|nr:Mu-like prophage major head subunit gpT family protein [Planctomycetota bacterium]
MPAPKDAILRIVSTGLKATAIVSAGGTDSKLKKFDMLAYSGGLLYMAYWDYPCVCDLAGLQIDGQTFPVWLEHDRMQIVGHTDKVSKTATDLSVSGLISGATPAAEMVTNSSANGYPWQASIQAPVHSLEFVEAGASATANGQTFEGPVYIARQSSLAEISFVSIGADDGASAKVAATRKNPMPQLKTSKKITASNPAGTDPEIDPAGTDPEVDPAAEPAGIPAGGNPPSPNNPAPSTAGESIQASRRLFAAEAKRVADINRLCAGADPTIAPKAILEGWDADKTELEVMRASRPTMGGPAIHAKDSNITSEVIVAALCQSGKIPNMEKAFKPQVLEAAASSFRHGLGLQELLLMAAAEGGFQCRSLRQGGLEQVLRAAFSTASLSGILSAVSNKALLAGFTSVEQVWRMVFATRRVNDFKTTTSYRMTMGGSFEKVAAGGQLKHATASEDSFPNKADTYGKLFSVDRQAIINDDLEALTGVPQDLGRMGAQSLNEIAWAKFLDNSSFFTTNNKNYISGAGSALGIAGASAALQKFRDQVTKAGKPTGIQPKTLLVPTALEGMAIALFDSQFVQDTTASTKIPTNNPHKAKFNPVCSAYLGNTSFTGASSTAFYLLPDTKDGAVAELVFLNGKEEPTVESADANFDVLGIQFRGFFDFGAALLDPRAGVKSAGA